MIAVKERPILFSTEMVKAILDEKKSQTRRVIKPQPKPLEGSWLFWKYKVEDIETEPNSYASPQDMTPYCPYGQVGDRLWVRETFIESKYFLNKDGSHSRVWYKADDSEHIGVLNYPWKPSIHMPRWASRITLEITDVRVERLQEITKDDCLKEGFNIIQGNMDRPSVRFYFYNYWDSIVNKKYPFNWTHTWKGNPWVWVISFKII